VHGDVATTCEVSKVGRLGDMGWISADC
jgi:hypothetical protein